MFTQRLSRLADIYDAQNYLILRGGSEAASALPVLDRPLAITAADIEAGDDPPEGYWDIIHLTGSFSARRLWAYFEQSLKHAHDRTLWIIDHPGQTGADLEILKAVLAIYDSRPEISHCTAIAPPPLQTILWKSQAPMARKAVFSSPADVWAVGSHDFHSFFRYLLPVSQDSDLFSPVGMSIHPDRVIGRTDPAFFQAHRRRRKLKKFLSKLGPRPLKRWKKSLRKRLTRLKAFLGDFRGDHQL